MDHIQALLCVHYPNRVGDNAIFDDANKEFEVHQAARPGNRKPFPDATNSSIDRNGSSNRPVRNAYRRHARRTSARSPPPLPARHAATKARNTKRNRFIVARELMTSLPMSSRKLTKSTIFTTPANVPHFVSNVHEDRSGSRLYLRYGRGTLVLISSVAGTADRAAEHFGPAEANVRARSSNGAE